VRAYTTPALARAGDLVVTRLASLEDHQTLTRSRRPEQAAAKAVNGLCFVPTSAPHLQLKMLSFCFLLFFSFSKIKKETVKEKRILRVSARYCMLNLCDNNQQNLYMLITKCGEQICHSVSL